MSSISTLAEIVVMGMTEQEDPNGAYPGSEPYSDVLLETMKAADDVVEEVVDVRSSETADSLFGDLLDNWQ